MKSQIVYTGTERLSGVPKPYYIAGSPTRQGCMIVARSRTRAALNNAHYKQLLPFTATLRGGAALPGPQAALTLAHRRSSTLASSIALQARSTRALRPAVSQTAVMGATAEEVAPLDVAVVGGGPAGLAAAVALLRTCPPGTRLQVGPVGCAGPYELDTRYDVWRDARKQVFVRSLVSAGCGGVHHHHLYWGRAIICALTLSYPRY